MATATSSTTALMISRQSSERYGRKESTSLRSRLARTPKVRGNSRDYAIRKVTGSNSGNTSRKTTSERPRSGVIPEHWPRRLRRSPSGVHAGLGPYFGSPSCTQSGSSDSSCCSWRCFRGSRRLCGLLHARDGPRCFLRRREHSRPRPANSGGSAAGRVTNRVRPESSSALRGHSGTLAQARACDPDGGARRCLEIGEGRPTKTSPEGGRACVRVTGKASRGSCRRAPHAGTVFAAPVHLLLRQTERPRPRS